MSTDDGQPKPTIGAVQIDIGFGNQFRIELIKLILTLSPALLAFTVVFRPKVAKPEWISLMWIGWIALGIATIGAMVNMYGWERFYISYRDYKNDISKGKMFRRRITLWRRCGVVAQFVGFATGVMTIAIFAAINLDKASVGGP